MKDLDSPLVSVIIPTYNRAHLLLRAVQSVLNQTYSHFELIIVDDASTDNTAQVTGEISDPRVRYVRHEYNQGGAAARNTGIDLAQGKYIAFLDSDDLWLERKLEKQVEALSSADPRVGIVFTGWRRMESDGVHFVDINPETKGSIIGKEFWDIRTSMICFMTYTAYARQIGGFDPLMRSAQDTDFVRRLAPLCWATSVPEILVVTPPHQGEHITGNLDALIAGRQRFIAKHADWLLATGQLYIWHRNVARFAILSGKRGIAWRALRRAIAEAPFFQGLVLVPWILFILIGPTAIRHTLDLARTVQRHRIRNSKEKCIL